MTGQEIFSLIQGLSDLSEKMERIKSSDCFLITNDYKISGYTVVSIARLCSKAERLISSVSYEPVRKN